MLSRPHFTKARSYFRQRKCARSFYTVSDILLNCKESCLSVLTPFSELPDKRPQQSGEIYL